MGSGLIFTKPVSHMSDLLSMYMMPFLTNGFRLSRPILMVDAALPVTSRLHPLLVWMGTLISNAGGSSAAAGTAQITGSSCALASTGLAATFIPTSSGVWSGAMTGVGSAASMTVL